MDRVAMDRVALDREEALRQLKATTQFTFVGDKVLLRQANVLRAAAEVQLDAARAAHVPGEMLRGGVRAPVARPTA